jgi:creatinine amidohydrolase
MKEATVQDPDHRTMARPWQLEECTLETVREQLHQVAILPLGATEPHNLHLPYGTDSIEATWIADTMARRAWQQGAKVLVLPTIPFGTESNLQQFPLAIDISPITLFRFLEEVVQSLVRSGIHRIVLLNSHGGNDLKPFLRQVYGKLDADLFLCNWYQAIKDRALQICKHPDDHAGEMETSLILACRPDLVARHPDGTLAADLGQVRPLRFRALQEGWVSLTRPWHLLTTQSGSGNPHQASAEKGEQLIEAICERLVPFLVELANSPRDAWFPFDAPDPNPSSVTDRPN